MRLIYAVACLSVLLLTASCKKGGPPEKPADMSLFPETIGEFKRGSKPADSSYGIYQTTYSLSRLSRGVEYEVHQEKNLLPKFKGDGEVLVEGENLLILFDGTDELRFMVYDGRNTISVDANSVEVMNEWARAFPYQTFNIQLPRHPVKIELPPADFVKERAGKDKDLEKVAREAMLEVVNLWLASKKQKEATISKLDPTTLMVSGPTLKENDIQKFLNEMGGNVREIGYRQIFFGLKAYKFPKNKPETEEKDNKRKKN